MRRIFAHFDFCYLPKLQKLQKILLSTLSSELTECGIQDEIYDVVDGN
jgi:hypothetical protein